MMETPLDAWKRCSPWLEAALRREQDGRSVDDVLLEIEAGRAWFWPERESAAVFRTSKAAHCWLAGGDLSEIMAKLPDTERWARSQGCDQFTLIGRKGWERVLRPHGFRTQTLLVKDI